MSSNTQKLNELTKQLSYARRIGDQELIEKIEDEITVVEENIENEYEHTIHKIKGWD